MFVNNQHLERRYHLAEYACSVNYKLQRNMSTFKDIILYGTYS